MWRTPAGPQMLTGARRDLFRGVIGVMVDHLVAECREGVTAWRYGIDDFDRWDVEQRLWLVEQVALGLLSKRPPPPPAAIIEAAFDAVLAELTELIKMEFDDPELAATRSWRRDVAGVLGDGSEPEDLSGWRAAVTRIGESIQGVFSYDRRDAFRDADPRATAAFLVRRGLPEDFFAQLPPLRTIQQTQLSIDRIQHLVFEPW